MNYSKLLKEMQIKTILDDLHDYIEGNLLAWRLIDSENSDFNIISQYDFNKEWAITSYKDGGLVEFWYKGSGTGNLLNYFFCLRVDGFGIIYIHFSLNNEIELINSLRDSNLIVNEKYSRLGDFEFKFMFEKSDQAKAFLDKYVWTCNFGSMY